MHKMGQSGTLWDSWDSWDTWDAWDSYQSAGAIGSKEKGRVHERSLFYSHWIGITATAGR